MTSGTGTCTVKYDQAGNANYNAAPQVTETVTAQKADQTITVTHARAGECRVQRELHCRRDGAPGGAVTFSSARRLHEQRRDVHDDERHAAPAPSSTTRPATRTTTPRRRSPSRSPRRRRTRRSRSRPTRRRAPSYSTSFTCRRDAPGGPVAFSSGGACTNSGATFTMTSGTGTCTVKYDQAGDANYNAAPEVTETVNPGKADQSITVTTHAPASAVLRRRSSRSPRTAPGGAVTFSSGGACSNSGATFTMTSGTGYVHGQVRPGRRRELQRRAAGDRVGDRGEGRPVDLGHYARAGQCRLRVAVHGGRERAGRRDRLLEQRLLHE